jgi:sentrin-specific protease 1
MKLGPPVKKRKKAKASFGVLEYFQSLKKADTQHRWRSTMTDKWSQIRHMKLPYSIVRQKQGLEGDDRDGITEGVGEEHSIVAASAVASSVIPPSSSSSTSTSSQAAKADNERVESITEKMDKLLRTRTEEAERIVRAKELAEEKRIDDEIRAREEKIQKEKESEKAARNLLRPLSDEEHDRVQEALYGAGPLNEQLATSATDSVQRKSMQTLRPGTWLNDEVIHYFYKMLANRDEALTVAKPERKRSHFFMSFFFTKLFDEGNTNEYSYRNVKRWSKKVPGKDIFDLDKVFFACNVSQMHWTCAVIFIQEKRIQFYDSMGGEGYYYSEGLLQYLKDEWAAKKGGELPDVDKWEIIGAGPGVPQQRNGYDCGVFTCMFADFLSVNRPLSFNQAHITECRHRIALSVLKGVAIE